MAVNLESVRAQVEILKFVRKREAELKKLKEAAQAAVKDVMGEETEGYLDGDLVITWSQFKEMRFDQAALAAAHPELFEEFKSANAKRSFSVK